MGELGREPLTIVEIDRDVCSLTYGTMPCRAALAPAVPRTNIVLWSEALSNAVWTKTGVTLAADTVAAPDGTMTADRLTATGSAEISQLFTKAASAITYTASVYAKGTNTAFSFTLDDGTASNRIRAVVNLAAGTLTSSTVSGTFTSGTSTVTAHPGGFVRIAMTVTSNTGTTLRLRSFFSTVATYADLWGAQVEPGVGASTYKRTGATAVLATWGTGVRKCYNTRGTCQSVPQFASTTQTLRFAHNQSGLPVGQTVFPALKSVSTRGAEINLSGIDPKTSALGRRARVTVALQDFAYHDTLTDPYYAERVSGAAQLDGIGYNPLDNGTFFGRLIARNPYYVGRGLRVKRGYVGDDPSAMDAAHYVVSEWSGPNAVGAVQITAKDVLDLADNAKAVAPTPSRGKLAAAITIDATTATLTPATVGVEYPASGRVAIGREVMTFTRAGDVLTFTARGVDGTKAAAHAVNDVAQVCLRYDAVRLGDAISDLLRTYAGVSASFIDTAAWQLEEDSWLSGLNVTATITKPTGVATLVGEICQHGVMVWWDEIAQEIRFRANRPLAPGEVYYPVTDAANILEDSGDVDRADDQRISDLFFWHGVIDPTEGAESTGNYAKLVVAPDLENPYGQSAIKEIFSRWFGQTGDDAAAGVIAERLLERYRITPKIVSFTVDVKDAPNVAIGSLIAVSSRLLQDAAGFGLAEPMQVNAVTALSERLEVRAETYSITGRFGFWMQDPQADYDTATDAEKDEGAFWMDDAVGVFPDGSGPYVYF